MTENIVEREEKQKKHYFFLNELQTMARDLPAQYQQRLPYDLLCSLANALLDGTVFEIVHSLKEVQQLEERNLFNQRVKLGNELKGQKLELQKKNKERLFKCQSRPHQLPFVQAQCDTELQALGRHTDDEIRKRDMKIVLELDQKVMDQQATLEKAGVPGFFVTNNPQEVKLQMYLLDFILKIRQLDYMSQCT